MAKLYFRYGTMAASKSANLLMSAHNYEQRGMRPMVFNFARDTRFGQGRVASRVGLSHESIPYDERFNFYPLVAQMHQEVRVSCLFVDEAQFLTMHQVEQLTRIVDQLDIPVICYGLRTDFQGNLFEGSQWLLAWADSLEEIKTVCWCNRKATFNARVNTATGEMVTDGQQIQIGAEEYVALCRRHWRQRRVNPDTPTPPESGE